MHIALICPDLHGHLNPLTNLGAELVRRGHQITLVATPGSRSRAEAAGFGFMAIGTVEHDKGVVQRQQARLGQLRGLKAMRFTGVLLRDAERFVLRDAPPLLKAEGVQAIVVDQVSPAGAAIADMLRIPYVVVCNALALNFDSNVPPPVVPWCWRRGWWWKLRNLFAISLHASAARPIFDEVNGFRKRHNLSVWGYQFGNEAGLAQIAQQPAFFDFPRRFLPPHFHFTAPWHTASQSPAWTFPFERLDGRPLIYASLGTLQNRLRHLFAAIAEGCANSGAQLVISLGDPEADLSHDWPGSPIVVPFAPQRDLIARSSLVITHAGLNTVLEALSAGVPMLAIPITNDQPGVARRLEWLRLGEVLLSRRATASRIRGAVERLLHQSRYRLAAEFRRAELQRLNGPAMASDIIERAFETRQRVLRNQI